MLGAGATIITPRASALRVGAGARGGAGAIMTKDVPAGSTVVGIPQEVVS
jgi:serine O-acetyltransferase